MHWYLLSLSYHSTYTLIENIETVAEIPSKLLDNAHEQKNIFEENISDDNFLQSLFTESRQTSSTLLIKMKVMKPYLSQSLTPIITDTTHEYSKDEWLACSSVICYSTDLFTDASIVLDERDREAEQSSLSINKVDNKNEQIALNHFKTHSSQSTEVSKLPSEGTTDYSLNKSLDERDMSLKKNNRTAIKIGQSLDSDFSKDRSDGIILYVSLYESSHVNSEDCVDLDEIPETSYSNIQLTDSYEDEKSTVYAIDTFPESEIESDQ